MRPLDATVEEELARLAGASHGVVTRARLLRAGVTRDEIRRRLRSGSLLREHRGVYRVGALGAEHRGDLPGGDARLR
jgi:hypothetical protein